ncbi:glycosyltransferase [Brevibacterium zhoupengii]|uniref:glycosyltransferase n=1 Tax=Brevibacterium zhoupengii TaxID=2898795 RepID=UPI001F095F23|nr:glycosyltransferase [Brevibacterium zhoupengii]
MIENMQNSMIAAMGRSSALLADKSLELTSVMPKICAELHQLTWSPIVVRTLFRCAVLEGSAHRARFVSMLLQAENQPETARFLADHAVSAGAKPWQKKRLTQLIDAPLATDFATSARRRFSLAIADDGRVHLAGDSKPGPGWLASLTAKLDQEPLGIHHDVLMINAAEGKLALETLSSLLASIQLLPVIPVLLADSPASVPGIIGILSSTRSGCLSPVIAARNGSGAYGLITAGGGELLDAGPTQDLVMATVDELAALASALGLVELYESPALRKNRAAIVEAFRNESSRLLPLSRSTRAFSRVLKFRGTRRATSPLRTAITGHLFASGYLHETRTLLEEVPHAERDRVFNARKLRAEFGTGLFHEAAANATGQQSSTADKALIKESAAAITLLNELDVEEQSQQEGFEPTPGKVLTILHASLPDQSGGYAVRAHSVLRTIRDSGFDVVAVTRPGFPEASNNQAAGAWESSEHDGIRYLRLGTRLTRGAGEYAYMRESVDHYCEMIWQELPAIIHLRSTYVSALPGLISARRFGLPVLYEVSGMWELVYEASNTARMESRRARTIRLEDAVLSHADGIVTLTEAMRDIIESRVSTRRPVKIVPNAVDAEAFSHREKDTSVLSKFGWDPGILTIGYIGTFVHYEGIDLLIRALARLQDRGVRFQALLVGDGAEAPRLRALAAELGLKETQLRFTGRVPHSEVADLYSVIDVCAYPRRLTPATRAVSPLKPFEAMASNKAVIVSDVPALAEIAAHGQRGIIVPNGDIDALAEAIDSVIREPLRTEKMVSTAATWTRNERNWDTVGRVMTEMLNSISEETCANPPDRKMPDSRVTASDSAMETSTI